MLTVPVHLGSTLQGLAQSDGILELRDNALVLHFQSRDTVLKVLKTRVQSITIPFEEIEEIHWKTSMVGCRLEIRITNLKTLSKIPNSKEGMAGLKVARRYKTDAQEIQSICSLAIAGFMIRRIGDLQVSDEPEA